MQVPPIPLDEAERLRALERSGLLRDGRVAVLDDITGLAALICRVPIALVSLVDRDRQVFRSRVGLAAGETPREISFCGHVLEHAGPGAFVVPDATADARFADNPLVTGEPHIRFYAALPLRFEGHAIGTLCIVDTQPREFAAEMQDALTRLARLAALQIEEFARVHGAAGR